MKTRADEIFDRFVRYHKSNPQVWELFCRFAFEAIGSGRKQFSSSAIIERIRWESMIKTISEDELKISNDFRSYYSRLFVAKYPQHKDFFRHRKLRSQDRVAIGQEPVLNLDFSEADELELMRKLKELVAA